MHWLICEVLFAFLHAKSLLKGIYSKWKAFTPKVVYSKRKKFAPRGSKFFPFREDPFSEGKQFDRLVSPEDVPISVNLYANIEAERSMHIHSVSLQASLFTSKALQSPKNDYAFANDV